MIPSPLARVAVYYAPRPDDPLWVAGAIWLGRDPASNAAVEQPDLPDIAAVTAAPRRYGFHATLKAPMRLHAGRSWEQLLARTAEVAAGIPAFDLPSLRVIDLDGFLALGTTGKSAALQALADSCVAGVDDFRAALDDEEVARRRCLRLSPEREAMLLRWGYPDVFEHWVFHMTLTRRLVPAEGAVYRPAAEAHFRTAMHLSRRVEDVCLFVQNEPGAPFTVAARLPLG